MNRPRPLLRSLVAATCGTTLLSAAVLGTGAAAFAAEEPAEVVTATADPATDAATGGETGTPPGEPTSSEATDPVAETQAAPETAPTEDQATDELVTDEPAGAEHPVQDSSAEGADEAAVAPPAQAPHRVSAPQVLAEQTPVARVRAPSSVPLGGDLQSLTIDIENYDPEEVDELQLVVEDGSVVPDLQRRDEQRWVDVRFVPDNSGSYVATIPVSGPRVELQTGISASRLEQLFDGPEVAEPEALMEGESMSALAEATDEADSMTIELTARLLIRGDRLPQTTAVTIPVLSPSLRVVGDVPEEVAAGESFDFVVEVVNETESDYGPASLLRVFHPMALLTAEEAERWDELYDLLESSDLSETELEQIADEMWGLFDIKEGELTLACSTGGTPRVIAAGVDDHPFFGRGSYVFSGSLDAGASVTVSCSVSVGAQVADAELWLASFLTVGENAVPLAHDPDLEDGLVVAIVGAAPAEPTEPTPVTPAPAQPAPVSPTPTTRTNPPAAAPVRQVPTTALPRTGTDPLPLAAAGLGLVVAGAAALLGGRRRAHD